MPIYLTVKENDYGELEGCKHYWWANFLFISNLVHQENQCLGQGWYVGADMQMFIFTPIILMTLSISKFLGLGIASALFLGSTAANIGTVYKDHYPPAPYFTGPIDPRIKDIKLFILWWKVYELETSQTEFHMLKLAISRILEDYILENTDSTEMSADSNGINPLIDKLLLLVNSRKEETFKPAKTEQTERPDKSELTQEINKLKTIRQKLDQIMLSVKK
uniref:Uncharacterized protein n=1 Tax=Acrobeloides nanus TaxID=290746 RepID=A0A914DTM8_9BILA